MTIRDIVRHGDGGNPIFGRERELARLYELVDRVPERGAALLIRGEAGIGKSTLLEATGRHAKAAGVQVLRTTGVQSEAQLAFAGLHQLVLPMLGHADRLPRPQRTALLAAFGMVEQAAADRFLIGLAVLELLSEVAERVPVLVVVDDAQWLDRSTLGVLGFVARRVEHEPIVLLLASRDEGEEGFFDEARLPEMRLGGLEEAAAGALLDAQALDLTPDVRERLIEQAEGNPLALVELPVLLGDEERGGSSPLPAPLPLTERLERAFASRAAELPPPTRKLLLLAATDDGDLSEILAAAATISGGESTFESLMPAVDARLTGIDGARLVFRHPLRCPALPCGRHRQRDGLARLDGVRSEAPAPRATAKRTGRLDVANADGVFPAICKGAPALQDTDTDGQEP